MKEITYKEAMDKYKDKEFYYPVALKELDTFKKTADVLKYVPLTQAQRYEYEQRLDYFRDREAERESMELKGKIIELYSLNKSISEINKILKIDNEYWVGQFISRYEANNR